MPKEKAKNYSTEFHANRHKRTIYSAKTILSIVLKRIPNVYSAIDVGCGVGTWLSVLEDRGVSDILGLDGPWIDINNIVIPKLCFKQIDLNSIDKISFKKYDLSISLEVAEHLSYEISDNFVSTLTSLSDYVLFSAAIPFQGGVNLERLKPRKILPRLLA